MNPTIIAYPRTENDVALAIKYASCTSDECTEARKTSAWPSGYPLKVMGRGGGHQYCGTSCDNDALIIDMSHFKTLEMKEVHLEGVTGPDGKPHTVTKEFHVGTGIRLKEMATSFNKNGDKNGTPAKGSNGYYGVTVPHGECPTVGIGGHAQTGGAGHIARNFGYCIDYVYGFTIVTADGSIRKVNRDSPEQKDKDLYWAVLGGSPGAFGVTTQLIFHPILDKHYPYSTGWDAEIPYTPKRLEAALKICEKFINRAKGEDALAEGEDALAEGLDMEFTFASTASLNKLGGFHLPPSIIIELVCKDMGKDKDTKAYKQMQDIIKEVKDTVYSGKLPPLKAIVMHQLLGARFNGKSHYKLSEMSLMYTRKPPFMTPARENRLAYNKAGYGSKDKVTPGWSKAYAKLLDDVIKKRGGGEVYCIVQAMVGGGAQVRNGKAKNAMSHRDAYLNNICFDLFRADDETSIRAAADYQSRFEVEVVNKHQTAHPKVMAQWATHGDLDMDKKQVWEKYIDNPETYHKLRRIKKEVDPDDVFHARFTIRPAPP